MMYLRADTSFMTPMERFQTKWLSRYVIKEFGDGTFHAYEVWRLFWFFPVTGDRVCEYDSLDKVLDWCEKQLKDAEVKSTTYVTWGE